MGSFGYRLKLTIILYYMESTGRVTRLSHLAVKQCSSSVDNNTKFYLLSLKCFSLTLPNRSISLLISFFINNEASRVRCSNILLSSQNPGG